VLIAVVLSLIYVAKDADAQAGVCDGLPNFTGEVTQCLQSGHLING